MTVDLFAENQKQSNCASFITNVDTISKSCAVMIALSHPSKYEVEAMIEFLQTKPEIETLIIGKLLYIPRTCSRQ